MSLVLIGIGIGLLGSSVIVFLVLSIRTMLKVSFLMKGIRATASRIDGVMDWVTKNEAQASRDLDTTKSMLISYIDESVNNLHNS